MSSAQLLLSAGSYYLNCYHSICCTVLSRLLQVPMLALASPCRDRRGGSKVARPHEGGTGCWGGQRHAQYMSVKTNLEPQLLALFRKRVTWTQDHPTNNTSSPAANPAKKGAARLLLNLPRRAASNSLEKLSDQSR